MSDKYQKEIDTSKISQVEDAGLLCKCVVPNTVESLTFNFLFLKQHDLVFYQLVSAAEQFFAFDPNTMMVKLRQLAETLAKDMASRFNIPPCSYNNQQDLLHQIDLRK